MPNMVTLKTMIGSNNWNMIYRKAQEEYKFSISVRTPQNYCHTFIQDVDDTHQKTMTKCMTNFTVEWCVEQSIGLMLFILQIYSIPRKLHPKINTLYLQRASNARKTYVLEGLVRHKDKVGSHILSKDFPFQECLIRPIILINELTLQNQSEAELYKNILGGEPIHIKIKNKLAEILYRKPVFITSKQPIPR